jgi:hypothetical protein
MLMAAMADRLSGAFPPWNSSGTGWVAVTETALHTGRADGVVVGAVARLGLEYWVPVQ